MAESRLGINCAGELTPRHSPASAAHPEYTGAKITASSVGEDAVEFAMMGAFA